MPNAGSAGTQPVSVAPDGPPGPAWSTVTVGAIPTPLVASEMRTRIVIGPAGKVVPATGKMTETLGATRSSTTLSATGAAGASQHQFCAWSLYCTAKKYAPSPVVSGTVSVKVAFVFVYEVGGTETIAT